MVHCSTLLKPIDSRSGGFQIQQLPRKRVVDADHELREVAGVLKACVMAANDQPPICMAMDCHGSFSKIHDMLLGLLPRDEWGSLPMLQDCCYSSSVVAAPLFCFKHLIYKDESRPILPCLDPKHIAKAVSRSLRSSARTLRVYLVFLSLCFSMKLQKVSNFYRYFQILKALASLEDE